MAEKEKTTKRFNPEEHMQSIQGKPYLPVAWRLVWFREEHPDWKIETEVYKLIENGAIVRAKIMDSNGNVLATAHKMETRSGFADYLEKAETGSIGRALAMCGYGTQFSPDLEEGQRLADAPIEASTYSAPKNVSTGSVVSSEAKKSTGSATLPQLGLIHKLYLQKKLSKEGMVMILKKDYNVTSHRDLTSKQASDYIEYLMKLPDAEPELKDDIEFDKLVDSLNGEIE